MQTDAFSARHQASVASGAEIVTSKWREEFAEFMKTQNAFWAKIVKAVGAVAE